MRIVHLHPVAAATGHGTEGPGLAEAVTGVLELSLGVLVAPQLHRPGSLELVALDEAPQLQVVAQHVRLAVGGGQRLQVRAAYWAPFPRRPEHHQQRLHHARGHGHQKELDTAFGDCLQVPAHGPQRPSELQRSGRLQNPPVLLDEALQRLRSRPDAFDVLRDARALPISRPPRPLRPNLRQRRQADRGSVQGGRDHRLRGSSGRRCPRRRCACASPPAGRPASPCPSWRLPPRWPVFPSAPASGPVPALPSGCRP
ncbi:hypothetical protein G6F35_013343 [Rhizopus arrhizus]|nr:hypothetical protein G6F35_013343 [Rhizopus arrhizus]